METRTYRGTDDRISLLGFGAMRLPRVSADTQKIDYDRARELIDCAYTHGVNYFDTAYRYHDGDSEPFLGRALAEYPRESYHLASKMPTWLVHSLDEGKRIFADQLERCRTDYFDFYLCHSVGKSVEEFTDVYEKTGLLDHLRAQKAAGPSAASDSPSTGRRRFCGSSSRAADGTSCRSSSTISTGSCSTPRSSTASSRKTACPAS